LGIAYLISSDERDNSTLYLASSSVGALSGFWLMYRAYAKNQNRSEESFESQNLQIVPSVLVAQRNNECDQESVVPGIRVSYTF
jgi:hypothetical protein